MQAVVSAIGIVAVIAWVVAFVSLVRVVLVVPRGRRISAIMSSGFWQFQKVRALGGPQVDIHLQRYAWSFAVFFAAIIASIFLGMMLSFQANQP